MYCFSDVSHNENIPCVSSKDSKEILKMLKAKNAFFALTMKVDISHILPNKISVLSYTREFITLYVNI